MRELNFPIVDLENTPSEFKVDSRLKICVECGHLKPDSFEFGISCEICGSLFVFSEKKHYKRNRRYEI